MGRLSDRYLLGLAGLTIASLGVGNVLAAEGQRLWAAAVWAPGLALLAHASLVGATVLLCILARRALLLLAAITARSG